MSKYPTGSVARSNRVNGSWSRYMASTRWSRGEQEGRVRLGVRDTRRHFAARHADLVNEVSMLRKVRMFRITPEHIDRAGLDAMYGRLNCHRQTRRIAGQLADR